MSIGACAYSRRSSTLSSVSVRKARSTWKLAPISQTSSVCVTRQNA